MSFKWHVITTACISYFNMQPLGWVCISCSAEVYSTLWGVMQENMVLWIQNFPLCCTEWAHQPAVEIIQQVACKWLQLYMKTLCDQNITLLILNYSIHIYRSMSILFAINCIPHSTNRGYMWYKPRTQPSVSKLLVFIALESCERSY